MILTGLKPDFLGSAPFLFWHCRNAFIWLYSSYDGNGDLRAQIGSVFLNCGFGQARRLLHRIAHQTEDGGSIFCSNPRMLLPCLCINSIKITIQY